MTSVISVLLNNNRSNEYTLKHQIMLDKKNYTNSWLVYKQNGDILTYFFKNGIVKAIGPFVIGLAAREWKLFRETEQLC